MNDLQICRLLIMMYRQGWLDAAWHMHAEANRQARAIKRQYAQMTEMGQ